MARKPWSLDVLCQAIGRHRVVDHSVCPHIRLEAGGADQSVGDDWRAIGEMQDHVLIHRLQPVKFVPACLEEAGVACRQRRHSQLARQG